MDTRSRKRKAEVKNYLTQLFDAKVSDKNFGKHLQKKTKSSLLLGIVL